MYIYLNTIVVDDWLMKTSNILRLTKKFDSWLFFYAKFSDSGEVLNGV